MKCQNCGHNKSSVTDSREKKDGEYIRRRRKCVSCGHRFTTYEVYSDVLGRDSKAELMPSLAEFLRIFFSKEI